MGRRPHGEPWFTERESRRRAQSLSSYSNNALVPAKQRLNAFHAASVSQWQGEMYWLNVLDTGHSAILLSRVRNPMPVFAGMQCRLGQGRRCEAYMRRKMTRRSLALLIRPHDNHRPTCFSFGASILGLSHGTLSLAIESRAVLCETVVRVLVSRHAIRRLELIVIANNPVSCVTNPCQITKQSAGTNVVLCDGSSTNYHTVRWAMASQ